jgi:Cdc6-like AAA superfamily ATPase
MPGTGKTVTTMEVVRTLMNDKNVKNFSFLPINAKKK